MTVFHILSTSIYGAPAEVKSTILGLVHKDEHFVYLLRGASSQVGKSVCIQMSMRTEV